MTGVRVAVLTALAVAGTIVLGWWTLLIVGVVRGLPVLPRRGAVVEAALAGGLGWLILLAWTAAHGPVGRLAREVGPMFDLPAWALVATVLLFAVVAAGAAATVTRQATRWR